MKFLDIAMKILSGLVIPLIAWGISLEVDLAVLRSELDRAKEDIQKAQAIQAAVNQNTLTLGRVEANLGNVDKRLTEIIGLIGR